jgi:16S rRNA (guanine527-N7)-methyltransferase
MQYGTWSQRAFTEELQDYRTASLYNLSDYFTEAFFETKKVVHLPIKFKG